MLARGFSVRAAARATLLACWEEAGRVEEDMVVSADQSPPSKLG